MQNTRQAIGTTISRNSYRNKVTADICDTFRAVCE